MKLRNIVILMTLSLGPASLSGQVASPSPVFSAAYPYVPTISFCEMVQSPKLYFDRPVRFRAVFSQAEEAQYLSDERCPLTHDEQIGVGHMVINEEESAMHNTALRKMQAIEYGGRANVTVVGLLRNASRRDFAWYHYRFDIVRFEAIEHVVVPYEGVLQAGTTYLASVRPAKNAALALVIPVRMPLHYALRVEWTNLNAFTELKKLLGDRRIVFSVVSDDIQQMTERRWNRTIHCKVISVE